MDHHAIPHIDATVRDPRRIIGPFEEHQIARLGIGGGDGGADVI